MENIEIKINGKNVTAPAGSTILGGTNRRN